MTFLGTFLLAFGFALASLGPAKAKTERIVAYTAHLPPLSIEGTPPGMAVEVMQLAAARAGIELDVRYQPWKRAQASAQSTPGTLIFSIGRSASREEAYHWIAPLFDTESGFVSLSEPVDSYQEAISKNINVGVLLGSGRVRIFKNEGLTNLSEIPSESQIAAMLNAGRIEAWYTMTWRAAYLTKKLGYDPARLKIGKPVWSGQQYLAAHKEFDPDISARLRQAIEDVRRSPDYADIVRRYTQ
ncbi:amino acid ABC transporter substrate-binding protein (PAAT family) [Roseibium hamelinense]|uniref:Amino acid ABC transporter substrate-binding protein (PAAT family) n=1 Tax=Roseibium hamelinense TaxID=150831 RepID=A0A562TI10_9HYPH|nr:transporter substrate-binding domain-containing protein [Roseibium hamelinense]MTI42666.1 transporter substrate-binding domain-containing protein [Roseibium hamelinense]TWI93291.1 amino acid ABC transporter substrate-binding protein (PAAT family) [Roseibium hamelinense]